MPKMKTHRSGAKRYRLTGSGKLMRGRSGRSHLNQKKTSKQKRNLDRKVLVAASEFARIRQELPYARHSR